MLWCKEQHWRYSTQKKLLLNTHRKFAHTLWIDMEVIFLLVCAGLRCMFCTLLRSVFFAMNLINLPINVLIKTTLQGVQSVPGNTRQKTADLNSLNSWIVWRPGKNGSKGHEGTSRFCPILINEHNQIQRRTNYNHEKKISESLSVKK